MIPKIKKIAEIYYKRLKLDEFWMLITGKPDLISGKLNISIRAYDKHTRPDFPFIGSQMWHVKWSSGICELEWILPLKKKGEHYTKGDPFIMESLKKAEQYFGRPMVSKEDHQPMK